MADKDSSYIVYVDESGDSNLDKINPDFPVFVLVFCVFKKKSYAESVIPKMAMLKFETFGHDMVILHEHDIRKQVGAFKGMNHPDVFFGKLTEIFKEADVTLISVVINKRHLKEKYCYPHEPYALAVQYGLERLYDFLSAKSESDKLLHVVFESRGKKEDKELEKRFRSVCDGENRNKRKYYFEPVIVSKKVNSNGLQLADLTARPIGLFVFRPEQKNRTYPILQEKLWKGCCGATVVGNGLKVFPEKHKGLQFPTSP